MKISLNGCRARDTVSGCMACYARSWPLLPGDDKVTVAARSGTGFDVGVTDAAPVWIVALGGWERRSE
jgi:hypothetical protein